MSVINKVIVLYFVGVSTLLFIWLNNVQPNYYIDEIFHIPQTLKYCDGNFREWDKKITTFPGLYFIAFALLSPFNLCSTISLRAINLIGTFLNFWVIHELVRLCSFKHDHNLTKKLKNRKVIKAEADKVQWFRLTTSLNITLLPPLYFLLFLFYTDVISTNMVLLAYLFHLRKSLKTSAAFGALAVLLRQTNIVWVAWITMEAAMDILENRNPKTFEKVPKNGPAYLTLLSRAAEEERNQGRLTSLICQLFFSLFPFILIGLSFVAFVILNGGIVLGDRTAHVATIHIPQIFYYSIFACFFSWPYVLPYLKDYLKLIMNQFYFCMVVFVLVSGIVSKNTLVHPYLLADNRHYTFYIWSRTIARYEVAKYALIPIYGFCIYSLWRLMNHLRFLSQISYLGAIFIVLVPQLLLEPRYFFIPYIIFRVNLNNNSVKSWQLFAETFTILTINILQFHIFSTKVFYWKDDAHNPQRISW